MENLKKEHWVRLGMRVYKLYKSEPTVNTIFLQGELVCFRDYHDEHIDSFLAPPTSSFCADQN